MKEGYPLLLDLAGRRVLVVGGGRVGSRRARGLAAAGARVVVVAPRVTAELAADPRIAVEPRPYRSADVDGSWLVHACTGVDAVDSAVAADADRAGIWCVRASAADRSAAWTPAVARVDDVVLAVNAGGDPARARALRDALELLLADGTVAPARHRPRAGRVVLVGGGPGDPDLITVRGRRLLAAADVVAVDRLAPRELLGRLRPEVEVVEVGKGPADHRVSQAAINELLVSRARQGKLVVRLKGGDPFVFGRGGEELLACLAAGVPCEVVPGVTSAVAVPAAAGIPVTHRGVARGFTVSTGHDAADVAPLAQLPGTLVILMGAARVARIAARLVAAGRSPDTPVAVVENGTRPGQRTTVGTLATIGEQAAAGGVRAPAVIVVGDVVGLAQAAQAAQAARAARATATPAAAGAAAAGGGVPR